MTSRERSEVLRSRQAGARYVDLMREFGIAKSTVWRWLKAADMAAVHPQQLTELKSQARQRAVAAIRRNKERKIVAIAAAAQQEIGALALTVRELQLIGAALYWAEGSKQRASCPSTRVIFGNTDARMLRLFIRFLEHCCGVAASTLAFQIFLHETSDGEHARTYWAGQIGLDGIRTAPIIWKRHTPTARKNTGGQYHGLLRIVVPKSTDLNRRIMAWVDRVCALGSGVMETRQTLDLDTPGSNPGSPASPGVLYDGMCHPDLPLLTDGPSLMRYWPGTRRRTTR